MGQRPRPGSGPGGPEAPPEALVPEPLTASREHRQEHHGPQLLGDLCCGCSCADWVWHFSSSRGLLAPSGRRGTGGKPLGAEMPGAAVAEVNSCSGDAEAVGGAIHRHQDLAVDEVKGLRGHALALLAGDTYLGLGAASWFSMVAWSVFLVVALARNPDRAWPLAALTAACAACAAGSRHLEYLRSWARLLPRWSRWATLGALGVGALVVVCMQLVVEGPDRPYRLQSLLGIVVLVGASTLGSRSPRRIPWQLVLSGLLAQFFLGYIVLRTSAGYQCFKALGDLTSSFLLFADVGSKFVFGPNFADHFFAFKVLPVGIFFSAFVSSMYYLGVLQAVVRFIALILRWALGTSLVESVSASGNIFLGQTEAPMLIRPFLASATLSELHCIMTGGFATIAGSVLAAYIAMGIRPEQLIGASTMSAPAAIMISKIVWPDAAKEKEHADEHAQAEGNVEDGNGEQGEGVEEGAGSDHFEFPPATENSIVEAAASGASAAIGLVANIVAMLIAFLALIQALDSLLGYLGGLVGLPTLSFRLICGYVFTPIAWIIGTPYDECFQVARLIGTKVFVNEFVAYSDLAAILEGPGGRGLSQRAELVATYALCGFSNVGSIGVQLGGLSALCPGRRRDFAKLAATAMIAGNICCFMTAAMAGILQ